ncbi:MAG: class I SAM-dependent methyltransferase [Microcoleaceae cyanobacterium]
MTDKNDQKLRQYYAKTAHSYDASQLHKNDEHFNALMLLRGIIADKSYQSILDVGSGTGRALTYLKASYPNIHLMGIEPVEELRKQALNKGLKSSEIICGDGYNLPLKDKSFDCVVAFGILHHVEHPNQIISEMFRVASKAVFISDHNIYGWGNKYSRLSKQIIRKFFGFKLLKFFMTKGVGYHDTDYDGIFYPFSLFEHLPIIASHSKQMYLVSTKGIPIHLYSQASHLAVASLLED